ncbi:MAG: hypothetical protein IPJ88_13100 [Myxococcales bacterium]|nr:MAG: hypothetical protein IPJ88_13100 [Myxococcales bacterium]
MTPLFVLALAAFPSQLFAQDSEPSQGTQEENSDEQLLPASKAVSWRPSEEKKTEQDSSFTLPPVELAKRNKTRTLSVFPFYFSKRGPGYSELLAGPYYNRRSKDLNADVAFPFYWSFRGKKNSTLVIPPFHYRGGTGFDVGLSPLFYHGQEKDRHYTVIPPLLSFAWRDQDDAYTFSTLFWRVRHRDDIDWGIFPLLWINSNPLSERILLPPLFFRFVDREERDALTVVPPFYHHVSLTGAKWGLAPLLFHSHDNKHQSLTLAPLFHYYRGKQNFRLLTPVAGYLEDKDSSSLYALLYFRHRGRTELDAFAPFVWSWRNPRLYESAFVLAPFLWQFSDPSSSSFVLAPFFGRWKTRNVSSTWVTPLAAHWGSERKDAAFTWIAPTLQFSHDPNSRTFNLHPIIYSTEARTHRHLVVAPLYWDFEDYEEDYRTSILFPLFWRFRNRSTVHQVAGLTYYNEGRKHGKRYYQFHLIPFFAYGSPRPGDHWWTVLYGLAGYERQGRYARAQALWLMNFQTDSPEN